MAFKEELPEQCPPGHAVDHGIGEAYRIVDSHPPELRHFLSKRALGEEPLPTSDPCGFSSCSLFGTLKQIHRIASHFPKYRQGQATIVQLSIPERSGLWTCNKKHHIHFWMYEEFDPLAAVVGEVARDA